MSQDLVEIIVDSKFFDRNYYSAQTGLQFEDDLAAATHYIEIGAAKRLRPSALFDGTYYLESNGDVANAGINPLVHFIQHGLKEGRRPALSRSPRAANPVAPHDEAWRELALARGRRDDRVNLVASDAVDIIIPVYRGYDDTLACIWSVLTAENKTPYNLVVVDDQSPEPELSAKLDFLNELGLLTLYRNTVNLGFVGTVNRGMRLAEKRDVILLNSDTIVYNDWVDRMRAQAYAGERVATVTPFSNNATIFSYPYTLMSNNQTLELDFSELDSICASTNSRTFGYVPTGVGFCFYIRRSALDECGYFDEDLFGKGYGEENDFCMRVIDHGWTNVAAYDIFVRHTGEVSFAAGASQGKREGFRRLVAAHPRYESLITDYVRRDPMRDARARIDVARFARESGGKGILMVEHGWGGGIEKHIKELADLIESDGIATIVCKSSRTAKHSLSRSTNDDFPNLPGIDWNDIDGACALLKSLNLGRVHLHSLVGFSDLEITNMLISIKKAGLKYDFTVHDYAPICPRITMMDWGGSYCDTPSRKYCETCLERCGSNFESVDIYNWTKLYKSVLDGAEHIYVPSMDVAMRMRQNGDFDYPYIVRPHPWHNFPETKKHESSKTREKGNRLIGIIGAIGPHKGARLLRAMAADAVSRNLPLQYIVYGYTDRDDDRDLARVTITGKYQDDQFNEVYAQQPCDLILYSSMWPETFCYSLDHAFNNMIYPVVFSLGAPADRVRATGFGTVIDSRYMFSPSLLNNILMEIDIKNKGSFISENGRSWISAEHYYSAINFT